MRNKGFIHTEETKEKMRKKAFGRKHSEESKIKIKIARSKQIIKHSEETKNKISIAHKGKKFSTSHIESLSISHTGLKQTEITKQKKRDFFKDKPLLEEHKKKIGLANKGNVLSKEHKEILSIFHINNPNRIFKDTSIEKKIKEILIKYNILFKQNVPIKGIANVDFYLYNLNIIIQCDGCYYHGCPEHHPEITRTKERDSIQTQKLTDAGFKVFRFWEHEINKSPEECINRIKHFLLI